MTRNPLPLHVLPVGARGDHRASLTCECRPTETTELMGGPLGRIVYVHHDVPQRPQTPDTRRPTP